MPQGFSFELVSPEKLIVAIEALSVQVPGAEGDFEVLKNHAPLMASLRPGMLTVKSASGGTQRYFVDGGFADVNPNGLTVLADQAIAVEELDSARIQAGIEAAEAMVAKAANDHTVFNANQKIAVLRQLQAS
jgi:F-type H+-transporting ATPase subunit epsilon